ncbi:MAG: hypothetical protein LUQ07_05870, partial [Methanospirillum sp.]|nr:hypothetical protein [Methanospirillum sp.]
TIPENGTEVIVPKLEPDNKIITISGDMSSFEDCCGGKPGIEASLDTDEPLNVFELITTHTLDEGQIYVPYTLYLNGKPYYRGKLVRSEESYTNVGCETCYEMEDHIKLVLSPGKYTLQVDDNHLCAAADGKGKLIFVGSDRKSN